MPEQRRVVVTGLGAVSPVGNTAPEAWANLLAGCSGIDTITLFEVDTVWKGWLSTDSIWSPGRRPALSAGVPG